MSGSDGFDIFLSYASPDGAWVGTLAEALQSLGLRVHLDKRELGPGENFVLGLSDGLRRSGALAFILSQHSVERPWVETEWTNFMAQHGPAGTILPVLLESVDVPAILSARQYIDAIHHDAAAVAKRIAQAIGKPGKRKDDDSRRLYLGEQLTFVLEAAEEGLQLTNPLGTTRDVTPPWKIDNRFTVAFLGFKNLTKNAVETDQERAELVEHATTLGGLLLDMLLEGDEPGLKHFQQALIPGRRPLVRVLSDDDWLLSLPWELLYHDGSFLVRDGRVDLVRSTPGQVDAGTSLREPAGPFQLVVNVSALRGSGLNYEAESYRITRSLAARCRLVPTELGTLDDLVQTARNVQTEATAANEDGYGAMGIHFSGHGGPGSLEFEDEEGDTQAVSINELLDKLRTSLPEESASRSCTITSSGPISVGTTYVDEVAREGTYVGKVVELEEPTRVVFRQRLSKLGLPVFEALQTNVLEAIDGGTRVHHRFEGKSFGPLRFFEKMGTRGAIITK